MSATTIRRGLPRVPGGEPWPPAATTTTSEAAGARPRGEGALDEAPLRRGLPRVPGGDRWPPAGLTAPIAAAGAAAASIAPAERMAEIPSPDAPVRARIAVRRGLPRLAGGDRWPPEGFAAFGPAEARATVSAGRGDPSGPQVEPGTSAPAGRASRPALSPAARAVRDRASRIGPADESAQPSRSTSWPRAMTGLIGVAGAVALVWLAVFAVRVLMSLAFMQDFLRAYPGEYALPETTEVGFPAWARWQHFLNIFFLVLIVRTGLQVRHQKKPPAYWESRRGAKISLNLWLHQSLDVLWLVNGVVFLVLIFATGHWARIVPTSWEVLPNALSALLQYASLDWPTENGWENYNALQQLAYFAIVFLAAPLAALSGVRMSGVWPKSARRLSRAFPIEMARAIHYPTMLFFVGFTIFHVGLVFATGALRNLNHMYAGQDAVNWVGFGIFVLSIAAVAAAWAAARPLVLAPIAGRFGRVSER